MKKFFASATLYSMLGAAFADTKVDAGEISLGTLSGKTQIFTMQRDGKSGDRSTHATDARFFLTYLF